MFSGHIRSTSGIHIQLLLHRLRQVRIVHHRILGHLAGELLVKVRRVDSARLCVTGQLRAYGICDPARGLTTAGLKGGWIFFAQSFLKSICLAKNGWFLIS